MTESTKIRTLIVDDEDNIVLALHRVLRRDTAQVATDAIEEVLSR